MEASLQFIGGQLAIAAGVYLLSKALPWTACLGVWLIAEGVVSACYALIRSAAGPEETWHGGAADVTD